MVKTITERIFGTTANVRVIDLLLEGRELDYSISDIGEGAGISRQHVYRVINGLMKYKLVKKSRIVGGTQLYRWDSKSELGIALFELQKALLKFNIKELMRESKK